jgi:LuxR family maltose regulon positive regulatory protein
MSTVTPCVWVAGAYRAYIDGDRPGDACVWLDTPAWFAWLDAAATTRFSYPLLDPSKGYSIGVLTVRKERRTRGGAYWTAYRRAGARVRKVYLGRTGAVTQARLNALAHAFLELADSQAVGR